MVAVLILLITCANIANLVLARTVSRLQEFSTRSALGASRGQLARQPIVESCLLATIGAICGSLVAVWSSRLLLAQFSGADDRIFLDFSLDEDVLFFIIAATAATSLMIGIVAAFQSSSVATKDALKLQGRSIPSGARARISSGFVVVQVALSLIPVVTGGLFVHTFVSLRAKIWGLRQMGS